MELSSVTNKLVQKVRQAQVEQIVAVAKVLGLKTGSQFLAEVQKVTQATPEERAELIKSIEANMAQLNKNSAAPAIKTLVSQLEAQKNIAEMPGVKLATLSVNTTTNPQVPPTTFLTYTNQPVQVGQTLLMQLGENQRLQLLQPLTKAEITSFNALLQTGNPLTTNTSATAQPANANSEVLSTLIEQHKLAAIKAADAIGEALRRLLPQKDRGQDLLTSLPKITNFIQQLPLTERTEWLSSQVQQSLKTLANHIRMADQLSNPKLLEMTLKNNGQSFENKLAQLINGQKNNELAIAPAPSAQAQKNAPIPVNIPTNPAQISPLLKASTQPIQANNPLVMPQVSIEKMASQDLKGALLGLLHHLNAELETTTPVPGTTLANDFTKNLATIALPQFLGLLISRQQGELSQKQLRTQLVMLMHQYTLGSLAKIQLQQAHTLNHQLSQADQPQPTQSWQFEVPVRQGHEVHPLHIHMEQQWLEEQDKDNGQNTTRMRQWNVMLSFNLPVIGQFHAQLILSGDNLVAKFWAEHENTLREAKKKIEGLKTQLENEGILVSQIQCFPGLPPKPKMSVSYSLVDIKT
ncbi:MAG TPA: flagellar hook-length control protein FliK [Cellvibrio sp.]|nr:flagellar hook-length control protein FliK [Cellvibrio sp.]